MANLLGWIGQRAKAVEAQINPFDNGRTYNTVMQNRPAPPPAPSVFNQISHAPVVSQFLGADRAILGGARNVANAPSNLIKFTTADITHNILARQNALGQLNQAQHAIGGFAQGFPRGLVQLEQSVRPGGIRQPVVPTNPVSHLLLGNRPVNSVQQDYSTARNTGASRANALTGAGISLAQDVPIGLGAAKLAKSGIKAGAKYDAAQDQVGAVGKNVKRTSEQISLDKTAPTNVDRILANQSNVPLSKIMSDKQAAQARLKGEQDALLHLQNGGGRDGAIKLYQNATNASDKMAKYKVSLVARTAKTPLNVSKAGTNPLEGKFNLPTAKPGEFLRARQNQMTINTNIDRALGGAKTAFGKLTTNDRQALPDYLEGTKNIAKAENPQAVKDAIASSKNVTDTGHALGSPYAPVGKNRYIKSFFPRNYADAPKQSPEAQMAIEEAALAGKPIPLEDQGNYMGFHQQARQFATRQEARQAGFKFLHSDPLQDLQRYGAGAKINIGNEAFRVGAAQAGVNAPTGQLHTIDLPGSGTARVTSAGFKALKNYAVKPPANLIKKGLQGANTTVIKTIVANPIFHGGNQEFNALFQGATRLPGNKLTNFGKVLKGQFGITGADRTAFYREGNFSPTYGKDNYGFIAKGLEKSSINPAKAEISPRAMARLEENIRIGLWKQAKARGMSADESTATINKVLGAPDVLGDMSNSVLLFYHYLKTNVKLLGDTGVQAGKGNISPLMGLAVGGAAYYAVDKAWQKATGNSKATVRAPGALGVGLQLAKAPGQLKAGRIPSVVTNHINPLITTGTEQATNRDLHRSIIGAKSQYNSLDGKYGSGRLNTAASNLVGPVGTVQDIAGGKTSVPYGVGGYLTGFYNSKPPSNTPGAVASKSNLQTEAQLKASKPQGQTLQQVINSKGEKTYAYSLSDGSIKTNKDKKTAQLAIQKDSFTQSGQPQQQLGNNVWHLTPAGKATHQTVVDYQYSVNSATILEAKASGNLKGYLTAANAQLQNIKTQLADPNSTTLNNLKLQKTADTLQTDIAKYTGYGGFTKPKSARSRVAARRSASAKAVSSFKLGSSGKAIARPKGVSVKVAKAPAFKAPKTRKLAVSKIPSNYLSKKLV